LCEEIIWVLCEEGDERVKELPTEGYYNLYTAMKNTGAMKIKDS